MAPGDLIDVMPLIKKWQGDLIADEAALAALPRWHWAQRKRIEYRIEIKERAIGMLVAHGHFYAPTEGGR